MRPCGSFTEDRTRLAQEISQIKCPALVVRGAVSDVLTDAAAEKFANALPEAAGSASTRPAITCKAIIRARLLDAMLAFFGANESGEEPVPKAHSVIL